MVYSQTRYTSIKSLIHEKIFSEGRGIFGYVVIFGYHLPGVFRQHAP